MELLATLEATSVILTAMTFSPMVLLWVGVLVLWAVVEWII